MPSLFGSRNASRRSRSPETVERKMRRRSQFPPFHDHHRRHSSSHKHPRPRKTTSVALPLGASTISKHFYDQYSSIFGLYLDIQKQLVLEELPENEIRGRWKSFVSKWNRGELAEGWYDPTTLQKAQASVAASGHGPTSWKVPRSSPQYCGSEELDQSSDENAVGPSLPQDLAQTQRAGKRVGPARPNLQDLELQLEAQQEDSNSQRQDLRHHRHLDRKQQKERLDELIPKAEAGTKDRVLEKKREKADTHRAFASAKAEAGGIAEVPGSDLLGDEDGGIEGFKKQKKKMERKKNEREVRREEVLRARMQEREERVKEYKSKEEATMKNLVALAKAKFGS